MGKCISFIYPHFMYYFQHKKYKYYNSIYLPMRCFKGQLLNRFALMYLFLRNKILQIQPLFLTSLHLSLLGFRNCPYSHGEFPTLFLYFYHLYVSPQIIYGIVTFIFNIYTIEEGNFFFFIYPPRLCAWGPRNKLAKDRFTREKQSLLTHMVETQ